MIKVKFNGGMIFFSGKLLIPSLHYNNKSLIWFLCFQKLESVSLYTKMLYGAIGIGRKRESDLE